MHRSHLVVILVLLAVAAGGGYLLGRSMADRRVGELEGETATLRDQVRSLDARLELATRPPVAPEEREPAAAEVAGARAPVRATATADPAATEEKPLDAEHRLRRIAEIKASIGGWFEKGEGPAAMAALKELAALVPEGREAAMELAVRINEDVNGDGKLGLAMTTFYTSLGDPAVADLMKWSFENPSNAGFRAMSAWSLPWLLPPEETIARFTKALDTEKDPDAQQALVWNLARMKNPDADAALLAMLKDPEHSASVRALVATQLAEGKDPAIEQTLRDLSLSAADPEVRKAAETALRIRNPPATGFLVTGTVPGSQAAVAGLQTGDVLVSYGGRSIKSLDELRAAAQDAGGSEAVDVVVVRGNERVKLSLRPGKMGIYGRDVKAADGR